MDSLVVLLRLDTTGFKKGAAETDKNLKDTRDAAARTGKEMEARGKQAGTFFGEVNNSAVKLFATLLGGAGVVAFARSATAELSALGRAATNIGISAQDLMAFRNAVAAGGGSADAAAASFQGLADAMERWKTLGQVSGDMLGVMGQIGGQANDTAMTIFQKFSRYAEANGGNRPQNRILGQLLGLDEGSINLALRGFTEVQKELAAARERGVPTDNQIKAVTAFQKAWTGTQQALAGVGNEIFAGFAPAMTRALDLVTDGILKNRELATTITLIGTGLTVLAALKLPGWLMGLFGGSGAAGAGAAAAGAGWLAALARILAPLSLLAMTGPAGGTDDDFSRRTNEKWLREHPKDDANTGVSGWIRRLFNIGDSRTAGSTVAPEDGGRRPINPAVPRTVLPTGDVTDRQKAAHDYFRAQGWSEEQTAGILANLQHESGFDPNSYNPAGGGQGARGIAQWRGPRLDRYKAAYGHLPDDPAVPADQRFREQLAFLQWELNNTHAGAGQSLRNARTAKDAANVILREFEVPSQEDQAKRVDTPLAEDFRRKFIPPAPPPPGGGSGLQASAEDPRRRFTDPAALRPPAVRPEAFTDPAALRTPGGGSGLQGSIAAPSFNIASLVINTQATDARGIAADIGSELQRQASARSANTGLS